MPSLLFELIMAMHAKKLWHNNYKSHFATQMVLGILEQAIAAVLEVEVVSFK